MAEAMHGNTSHSFEQFMAEFGPEFPPVYDPAVQSVLDLAATYQKDFDATPDAPDEMRRDLMNDLDKRWPHMNRPVVVSGRVRAQQYDIDPMEDVPQGATIPLSPMVDVDGRPIMRDYDINNYSMLSGGFCYEEEPMVVDNEHIGTRYLLRLLFEGNLNVSTEENSYIWTTLRSSAKPDGVVLESPYASLGHLRSRAETYFPHVARQLKEIESLGESASTADRLLKLRDIPITYRGNTWLAGEMVMLAQYVKQVIDVEADPAPMLVAAKRGARFFNDPFDANNNLTTDDRTTIGTFDGDGADLMTITRINLLHRVPFAQPEPPTESQINARHNLGVALSVRLLRRDRGEDMAGMLFLHDVLDIQDTRRMLLPKSDAA